MHRGFCGQVLALLSLAPHGLPPKRPGKQLPCHSYCDAAPTYLGPSYCPLPIEAKSWQQQSYGVRAEHLKLPTQSDTAGSKGDEIKA